MAFKSDMIERYPYLQYSDSKALDLLILHENADHALDSTFAEIDSAGFSIIHDADGAGRIFVLTRINQGNLTLSFFNDEVGSVEYYADNPDDYPVR